MSKRWMPIAAFVTVLGIAHAQDATNPRLQQAEEVPATRPMFQSPPAAAPAAAAALRSPAVAAIPDMAPPVPQAQSTEVQLDGSLPVFGHWLFQGSFGQQSFRGFNPDYVLSIGDMVDLQLWGAFSLQTRLEVDAKGNIFVPQVGPIAVASVRNGDLNDVVSASVKRVYREDVGVYASLAASQPVKVFVGGGVRRPGLYAASASDSVLSFLDRAGGIDARAGSFLDVRLLRGGRQVTTLNLYDFLLQGSLPPLQFHDGDTLFVGPIKSTAKVTGMVARPAQFEFQGSLALRDLLQMAGVNEQATNVRITRNQGQLRQAEYLPLDAQADGFTVMGGDEIEVIADRLIGSILVSVQGELAGGGQFVFPYQSTLADLMARVQLSEQSNRHGVQLFRKSIAQRQKQVLELTLQKLEQAALSARSATREEAQLRAQDAQLLMQFVERARRVEPRGQLVLPPDTDLTKVALEDGDVIRIPRQSNTVAVHGEVYFPNSFVYSESITVTDYIKQAGGMTQYGNEDRVLVLAPSGEVRISRYGGMGGGGKLNAGDEVLVLPQIDAKRFQLTKDIFQVMYQIAIAAGVVVAL